MWELWKGQENWKKFESRNGQWRVSIIGLSEVIWKGQSEIHLGNYTLFYLGENSAERGVAIAMKSTL